MRLTPAVLVNGKLVTGCNHGEAFGKLTGAEQDDPKLLSGFYDKENNKFVWEDRSLYFKSILMIRHADAIADRMTPLGRTQAKQVAAFLVSTRQDSYRCYYSPRRRAVETALLLAETMKVKFSVNEFIRPKDDKEDDNSFATRLTRLLDILPEKSLLISHSDVIQTVILMTTGEVYEKAIPNCSVTLIHDGKAVYLAKGA